MLLYQVLYGFVRVFNLFLPRLDLLRPWPFGISGRSHSATVYYWHSLLFERLLVHFVDKKVDIFTHFLKLVPQLLILRLEKLLFLGVVTQSFYKFGCITHLFQFLARVY